jgi:hypothetical protein
LPGFLLPEVVQELRVFQEEKERNFRLLSNQETSLFFGEWNALCQVFSDFLQHGEFHTSLPAESNLISTRLD